MIKIFQTSRFTRVDGSFGTLDIETNETSGMIRSLVLEEADLASPLTITTNRLNAVDFLVPYYQFHDTLVSHWTFYLLYVQAQICHFYVQVFRRHDNERVDWTLYLKPIQKYLWIALLLHSLILVIGLSVFFCHYDKKLQIQTPQSRIEVCIETVKHYFMISSSYLGRSYAEVPHNKMTSIKEE